MLIHKLRQIIFICLFLSTSMSFAASHTPAKADSDEEAFLIRRIAEFWKDGDYSIVKTQIINFFDQYPESGLKDYFLGILGDIYLQENNYDEALVSYEQIKDPKITGKIILNKLQCYYENDQYNALIQEGTRYANGLQKDLNGRTQELYFLLGEGHFRLALIEENPVFKKELALTAQSYYARLTGSQYEEVSVFALAEIYAVIEEHERGAELYLTLAEKHPEMKEDLLFQAAVLQSEFDRDSAIDTFNAVKELGGNKSSDASFNLIVLFFQNESYENVLSSYEAIAASVPESYKPTFDFVVGKSFFQTGKFNQAVSHLEEYIESQYIPNEQLKNALLLQMTCAHQTKNEELFNTAFEKLDTLFPNDAELPKALFMHAMILKEQGDLAKADAKLQLISEKFQDFEDKESFLFEYGLLSHQNQRWATSYKTFKNFIRDFPESHRTEAAWKLFLSSSLSLYKNGSEEFIYGKEDFFQDLQLVLNKKGLLDEEEMKDYGLLYAKTAYEIEAYSDALHVLHDLIFEQVTEEADPFALAEAHFIAGLCYGEKNCDHSGFCMHLEQAMYLSPETYDSASTHLQLYNAYISMAGYGDGGEMAVEAEQYHEFIAHAAEHLQTAITKGEVDVKNENRLWLANHYYQDVKDYIEEHWTHKTTDHPEFLQATELSTKHFKSILFENGHPINLKADNVYLENEFLKLGKLMEYQNLNTEKLALLKKLIEQQSLTPDLNWTTQKQALFELATVYRDLGEQEKAFETYNFIHSSSGHFPLKMANTAVLESARLHFNLLNEDFKTESNEEVLSILNHLKELQIRKNVASEPTHLEAALDYAQIRSEIGEASEQDSRYLFFLKRMEDDFTSQEDLVTQDYLMSLKQSPDKKQVFEAYMKFIDAEKRRLEAKQALKQDSKGEVEELNTYALSLYNELKNNPATPSNLYSRITGSIEEINSMNAY